MSYVVKNSLPAERARGLVFYEDFKSEKEILKYPGVTIGSDVIINNGVASVTGTGVNSQIDYGNIMLFSSDFTAHVKDINFDSFASTNFILGNSNSVEYMFALEGSNLYTRRGADIATIAHGASVGTNYTFTVAVEGTTASFYKNGVLLGTDTLNSGYTYFNRIFGWSNNSLNFNGTCKEIRIYNKALTENEILDLNNKSTFLYNHNLILDHKFDLNSYDAVNSIVKDNSKYEYDATIPAAPNNPTKLTDRKGFYFDGITAGLDYMTVDNFAFGSTGGTISAFFSQANGGQATQTLAGHYDGSGRAYLVIGNSVLKAGVADKSLANIIGTSTVERGKLHHGLITWDTTNYYLYLDGVLQTSGTHNNSMPATTFKIGDLETLNYKFNGNIYDLKCYNKVLSHTQVIDLNQKLLKSYNKV